MDLFIPVTSVALNAVVKSTAVVLSDIGASVSAVITSGNAVFVKNGVGIGTSTTVSDGDELAIKILNSGSEYSYATHVLYVLGGLKRTWTVVTLDDTSPVEYLPFTGVAPIDLIAYQDSTVFNASSADNVLRVYSQQGTLLKTVQAKLTTAPTSTGTSGTLLVAHYFSDYVLRIDAATREVLAKIDVGARPYGVTYTPTSPSDTSPVAWITVSSLNKVVCLNSVGAIVAEYATGVRPLGIASTVDGNHVYIANNGGNSVTHLARGEDGTTWTSSTVTVGSKPFEIATDSRGNAWVTCSGSNNVSRISRANTVTTYGTGLGPRGIVVDASGSSIWVACSSSGTLLQQSTADGSIINTVAVGPVPFAVAQGKDGSIYVSLFGSEEVKRLKAGVLTTLSSNTRYPYALAVDLSGNIWIAEYWSNTPSYTYTWDRTPFGISLTDLAQIPPATLVVTNTITIRGIDRDIPASVPDIHGAVLIKNGANVGRTAMVSEGDTLAVAITSPNTYSTSIEVPVFVGNTWDYFSSVTPDLDDSPDPFVFVDVANAELDSTVLSNTVLLSGLDNGYAVPFTTSTGVIRKNGVSVGSSTTVVNGDRIVISVTAPSATCRVTYAAVQCGSYSTTWSVLSLADEGNTPMEALVFPDAVNVLPNTVIISEEALVSGLTLPTLLSTAPIPGNSIRVNGVSMGFEAQVFNDDLIQVETLTDFSFASTKSIVLQSCGTQSSWTFYSIPDIEPRTYYFDTVYEVPLRSTVESNEIVIEDISPNTSITVSVVGEPSWAIHVNGVTYPERASVQLGDIVSISGPITGVTYSSKRTYELESSYAGSYTGVFASLEIYTHVLSGPSLKTKARSIELERNWVKNSAAGHPVERSTYLASRGSLVLSSADAVYSKLSGTMLTAAPVAVEKATSNKLTSSLRTAVTRVTKRSYVAGTLSASSFSRTLRIADLSAKSAQKQTSVQRVIDSVDFKVQPHATSIVSPEAEFYSRPYRRFLVGEFARNRTAERGGYVSRVVVGTGASFMSIPTIHRVTDQPSTALVKSTKSGHYSEVPLFVSDVNLKFHESEELVYLRNSRSAVSIVDTKFLARPRNTTSIFDSVFTPHIRQVTKNIDTFWQADVNVLIMTSPPLFVRGVKDIRISEQKEYIVSKRSNVLEVDTLFTKQYSRSLLEVDTLFTKQYSKNFVERSQDYIAVSSKSAILGPQAKMTVSQSKSFVTFVASAEVQSRKRITVGRDYFKDYFVHNCVATGTCAEHGAYPNAEQAIAAGLAAGHTRVTAVALGDTCFMWVIPAEVESKDCVNTSAVSKFAMPGKWYVHGG